jgi:hypothetical protein
MGKFLGWFVDVEVAEAAVEGAPPAFLVGCGSGVSLGAEVIEFIWGGLRAEFGMQVCGERCMIYPVSAILCSSVGDKVEFHYDFLESIAVERAVVFILIVGCDRHWFVAPVGGGGPQGGRTHNCRGFNGRAFERMG